MGTTGVVTNPDGLEGNWVELRGHYISATLLKKPLPQNFTLSYDLVASQNFTWGARINHAIIKRNITGQCRIVFKFETLVPALMVEMEKLKI